MNQTPITASNLRIRKSFAKNKQVIEIPNLIELQKRSYEAFLQKDTDPDRRGVDGLGGARRVPEGRGEGGVRGAARRVNGKRPHRCEICARIKSPEPRALSPEP